MTPIGRPQLFLACHSGESTDKRSRCERCLRNATRIRDVAACLRAAATQPPPFRTIPHEIADAAASRSRSPVRGSAPIVTRDDGCLHLFPEIILLDMALVFRRARSTGLSLMNHATIDERNGPPPHRWGLQGPRRKTQAHTEDSGEPYLSRAVSFPGADATKAHLFHICDCPARWIASGDAVFPLGIATNEPSALVIITASLAQRSGSGRKSVDVREAPEFLRR